MATRIKKTTTAAPGAAGPSPERASSATAAAAAAGGTLTHRDLTPATTGPLTEARPTEPRTPRRPDGDGAEELPPLELYDNPGKYSREGDHYTPWLVLRYVAGDVGARPLPPGTNFWCSPDVWVESSVGHNQPVAGEKNRMFARVTNRGAADAGWVKVRFWWANPSMAITEVSAHLIGTTDVYLPQHYSAVVECPTPWVPVMQNQGHECILAEASAPVLDPLMLPLEPVLDRHVCQRNLHVIEGAPAEEVSISVGIANISPAKAEVEVVARALPFKEVAATLRAAPIAYAGRLVETGGGLDLRFAVDEVGTISLKPSTTWARRLVSLQERAALGGAMDCRPVGAVVRTVAMEAGEQRQLEVTARIPPEAKPGQGWAVELSERIGEVVTGGYTVYVLAAKR